jgi:medium-chain acyl-[acyl-carrier-protein] hydrolase
MRLLCLPYAGAGASIFRGWSEALPDGVAAHGVDLPGRGVRFAEPPCTSVAALVEDLADRLDLTAPFALFGHSLGGLIAFELTRELRRRGDPLPEQLFVSASRAPRLTRFAEPLHALPDTDFVDAIARLGGVAPALLNDPELLSLALPALRADLALVETYEYRREEPLECAISLFGGTADRVVELDVLEAWADETAAGASLRLVAGDHFYLVKPERAAFLSALAREIEDVLTIAIGGRDERPRRNR